MEEHGVVARVVITRFIQRERMARALHRFWTRARSWSWKVRVYLTAHLVGGLVARVRRV